MKAKAAKSKVKSTKSGAAAMEVDGGKKNHMFTEREAGPQKPGVTSSEGQDAPETDFAAGGKTKMFGQQGANPAPSGTVSESQPGVGAKFAQGGKTKMFGFTGSKPATPA